MKTYYNDFLQKLKLDNDAYTSLLNVGEIVISNYESHLKTLIKKMYRTGCNLRLIAPQLEEIANKTNLHPNVLYFIFVAVASQNLQYDFKRADISMETFLETINDFSYKITESKMVDGCFGIQKGSFCWYSILFNLSLFKLGRLEFERIKLPFDCTLGEQTFKRGTLAFSVHIPSCGAFSRDLRLASYKKAYDFFADELQGEPILFVCHSWLLYPENANIFAPNSNSLDFYNEWHISHVFEEDTFTNAWRVFGKNYESGNVPNKTALQRAFIKHLEQGGHTGNGYGIMLFDGEKTINY